MQNLSIISEVLSKIIPPTCSLTVMTCDADVIMATTARLILTQPIHTLLIHCPETDKIMQEVSIIQATHTLLIHCPETDKIMQKVSMTQATHTLPLLIHCPEIDKIMQEVSMTLATHTLLIHCPETEKRMLGWVCCNQRRYIADTLDRNRTVEDNMSAELWLWPLQLARATIAPLLF